MNKKVTFLVLLLFTEGSCYGYTTNLRNNYNKKTRPFLYTAEVEWRNLHTNVANMSVGDQFIWYVQTGQTSSNDVRGWQNLTSSNPSVVSVASTTNSSTSSNVEYEVGGGAGNVNGASTKQVHPSFTLTANAPGTTVLKGSYNNGGSWIRFESLKVTIPQ